MNVVRNSLWRVLVLVLVVVVDSGTVMAKVVSETMRIQASVEPGNGRRRQYTCTGSLEQP